MPRGGKRPGAGAPKGNLNALTRGNRSPRLLHVGLVLALRAAAADPPLAQTIEQLLLDRMRAVDSEAMKNIAKQTDNQTPSAFTPVLPEGPLEG